MSLLDALLPRSVPEPENARTVRFETCIPHTKTMKQKRALREYYQKNKERLQKMARERYRREKNS